MEYMKAVKPLEIKVPIDLSKALRAVPRILVLWKDLTPIARRDFIGWIESAKQPETRKRRIGVTCSKLARGKRRPCCYALVPMNFYKALGDNPKAKAGWKELTPNEKRDFVSWVKGAKDSEASSRRRVEEACLILATGKRVS